MRKLQYETPSLRVALTENEIRTNDPFDSAELTDDGVWGEEVTENDN